ncbi:MAG: 2TM domain-containing protein, partial [Candidatus Dormiibacterota bacterium]
MAETSGATATSDITDTPDARAEAIKRLSARRDFVAHLVAFVVINAGVATIWFATGRGYFWPAWLIGVWAAGLALHAWDVYGRT